jgi:hypothetical protein
VIAAIGEVIIDSPDAVQLNYNISDIILKFKLACNDQLRYLQTLHIISAENNSTFVFPVPNDILSLFVYKLM